MSSGNVAVSYVQVANILEVVVDDGNNHKAVLLLSAGSISLLTPTPITSGGTGQITASAAFDALSGVTNGAAALTGLLGLSYVTNDRTSGGTPGPITLALGDAGKRLYHSVTDAVSRVVTIAAQASVAIPDTKEFPFYVEVGAGALVFTPANGVTLTMNGASVATATAAAGYSGQLSHITGDTWHIVGENLS